MADKKTYLDKDGTTTLWSKMKSYYSNALRGDTTELSTTSKTIIGAINELYDSIDPIVNAPKVTALSISGPIELSEAGDYTYTVTPTPSDATPDISWKAVTNGKLLTVDSKTSGTCILSVGDNFVGTVTLTATDKNGATATYNIASKAILATAIEIIASDVTEAGNYTFEINPTPPDATLSLTWEIDSENSNITTGDLEDITLSTSGSLIIPDGISGTLAIKVTDSISELTETETINIDSRVKINSLTLSGKTEITSAGNYTYEATYTDSIPTSYKNITYSCSDENLTISDEGILTVLSGYNAEDVVITVEDSISGLSDSVTITSIDTRVKLKNLAITGDTSITEAGDYVYTATYTSPNPSTYKNLTLTCNDSNLTSKVSGDTITVTVPEGYNKSNVIIAVSDSISSLSKTTIVSIDTRVPLTDLKITGVTEITSAGDYTYTVTYTDPVPDTYHDITISCSSNAVTISDSGILTVPGNLNLANVVVTVEDNVSGLSDSITITSIDTRTRITAISLTGDTKITEAGSSTYTATITPASPDYYDLSWTVSDDTLVESITPASDNLSAVVVFKDQVEGTTDITITDSISGVSKSISVEVATKQTLTLSYVFENEDPGNAEGYIQLSTTSANDYGNYEVYYGDASGAILSNYTSINYADTYTNTSDNDTIPITLSATSTTAKFDHFISVNALPSDAKTIVACKEGTTTVLATYTIPTTKQTSSLNLGDKKYSVGLISDLHIDAATDTTSNDGNADFDNTIQLFKDYGVEAICSAGDMTDDGEDAQWTAIQTLVTKHSLKTGAQTTGTLPLYIAAGNHDAKKISTFTTYTGYNTYNKQVIGDDVYIFCGLNNSYNDILGDNFDSLSADLETYKDKSRVFVFQHVPIPATDGNAEKIYAYNAWTNNSSDPYATNTYSEEFATLMKKYDNVILINGHSHLKMFNQVYDENANYYRYTEGGARMFHLPSLTYPREWQWDSGTGDYTTATDDNRRYNDVSSSEACIMDVYENGFVFKSLNCKLQKFEGIAEYACETTSGSSTTDNIIFYDNREYTSTGAASGYSDGATVYYYDADGVKQTSTQVLGSSGNYTDKYIDASLVSSTSPTGTIRTISTWTMLAEVSTTSATTTEASTTYQRAICDCPNQYNNGINVDYFPGYGFVVNCYEDCIIGAASSVGAAKFTDSNSSASTDALDVSLVRFGIRRDGNTVEYTTDGSTWTAATVNIDVNASSKAFTVGGTGGTGSHPFFGQVNCTVYDSATISQSTINNFFEVEDVTATAIEISGSASISESGDYTYTVTPTPSNATTNISWSCSGITGCTISNGILTVPSKVSGTLTITATDSVSGLSAIKTVTVDTTTTIVATALTIDGKDTITDAGSYTYTVTPTPSNASVELTWSVDKTDVTISSDGKLTVPANTSETVIITVSDSVGGLSTTKEVTLNTGGTTTVTRWAEDFSSDYDTTVITNTVNSWYTFSIDSNSLEVVLAEPAADTTTGWYMIPMATDTYLDLSEGAYLSLYLEADGNPVFSMRLVDADGNKSSCIDIGETGVCTEDVGSIKTGTTISKADISDRLPSSGFDKTKIVGIECNMIEWSFSTASYKSRSKTLWMDNLVLANSTEDPVVEDSYTEATTYSYTGLSTTAFNYIWEVNDAVSSSDHVIYLIRHSERLNSDTGSTGTITSDGIAYAKKVGQALSYSKNSSVADDTYGATEVYRTEQTAYYIAQSRGNTSYGTDDSSSYRNIPFSPEEIDGSYITTSSDWGTVADWYKNNTSDVKTKYASLCNALCVNSENSEFSLYVSHDSLMVPLVECVSGLNIDIQSNNWINFMSGIAIIVHPTSKTYEVFPVKSFNDGLSATDGYTSDKTMTALTTYLDSKSGSGGDTAITAITVKGDSAISAAGTYSYSYTVTPTGASTSGVTLSCNTTKCTFSESTLTVPSNVSETITITATDSATSVSGTLQVTIDTTSSSGGDDSGSGATPVWEVSFTGDGSSCQQYSKPIMAQSTGLTEWTALFHVDSSSGTSAFSYLINEGSCPSLSSSPQHSAAAFCISTYGNWASNKYTFDLGGNWIEGTQWSAGNSTTGTYAIRRSGSTVEYSTDGTTWKSISVSTWNTSGNPLTVGAGCDGTTSPASSGMKVDFKLYNTASLDSSTITSFFGNY